MTRIEIDPPAPPAPPSPGLNLLACVLPVLAPLSQLMAFGVAEDNIPALKQLGVTSVLTYVLIGQGVIISLMALVKACHDEPTRWRTAARWYLVGHALWFPPAFVCVLLVWSIIRYHDNNP